MKGLLWIFEIITSYLAIAVDFGDSCYTRLILDIPNMLTVRSKTKIFFLLLNISSGVFDIFGDSYEGGGFQKFEEKNVEDALSRDHNVQNDLSEREPGDHTGEKR